MTTGFVRVEEVIRRSQKIAGEIILTRINAERIVKDTKIAISTGILLSIYCMILSIYPPSDIISYFGLYAIFASIIALFNIIVPLVTESILAQKRFDTSRAP